MAATQAQIDRLRRVVNEPTDESYTDADLAEYLERYPLEDGRGEGPWVESETTPGTLEENEDWIATYDMNAAAADVLAEKAAVVSVDYSFSADGGRYDRNQVFEQLMQMSRYYRSRRSAKTITLRPEPLLQGSEELDD